MTVSKKEKPHDQRSRGDVARVPATVPERFVISLAWAVPRGKKARPAIFPVLSLLQDAPLIRGLQKNKAGGEIAIFGKCGIY
jgi:hypothetical protein